MAPATYKSVILQGTGQTMVVNWGDGFFTDADVLANYVGMSNPNNFFTTIVGMPYINQVRPWMPAQPAALIGQPCIHQLESARCSSPAPGRCLCYESSSFSGVREVF